MTLISNQENTTFEMRPAGGPEWQRIGKGKIIGVQVAQDTAYEFAATPDGYRRKEHTLSEPVSELRFTFEICDKLTVIRGTVFELDVRVVSVHTARTVASVHDRAEGPGDLRRSVEACASRLLSSGRLRGTVAVAPFEAVGATNAAQYGGAAASMMISALQQSKDLVLIERAQLARILNEHDLSLADIAKDPRLLGSVSSIGHLVIGTVSALR